MASEKRFGLILPGESKTPQAAPAKRPIAASIFDDDDASDDAAPTDPVREAFRAQGKKAMLQREAQQRVHEALAEDPSVFEYDAVYDDMQQQKSRLVDVSTKERHERKAKYIGSLLATAKSRQREQDRRQERKIQHELEAEGEKFADKESFVTSAYKKKLEELQADEDEEQRKDALDQMADVTKQSDLSGFYRHFMKQQMGEETVEASSVAQKPSVEAISDGTHQSSKRVKHSSDEVGESERRRVKSDRARSASSQPDSGNSPTIGTLERRQHRRKSSERVRRHRSRSPRDRHRHQHRREHERRSPKLRRSPGRSKRKEHSSPSPEQLSVKPTTATHAANSTTSPAGEPLSEAASVDKFARRNSALTIADAKERYAARQAANSITGR